VGDLLRQLEEVAEGLASAAKKDRLLLLTLVVPRIPREEMHLIPAIIPEAVLGTKEPSEKARGAAFDLIVAMGRKMAEGGLVRRDMVNGMDEDDASDSTSEAVASLEEYVTMLAGGLAGATPHMISATVTALSRIIFEFKGALPMPLLSSKKI
jgi:ribosomal RNA-processing protein 12